MTAEVCRSVAREVKWGRDEGWLKCIEDIKAEIEERKGIAVRAMFDSHYTLKEQTRGLINGYDSALRTIDRHVNELRGEADASSD